MKKRFLAALLCLVLIVGLLPTAALAAEDYTIYYNSIDGDFHRDSVDGAEYDADHATFSGSGTTLTLSDFHFTTSAATALVLPNGTTLVLNGTSAVTSTYSGGGEETYGIECAVDLTISGGGTLNATGGVSSQAYSSGAKIGGSLTVNSGTLNAKGGGGGGNSFGAEIGDSITMNSGTLTCTGGTGDADVIGIIMGESAGPGTLTMNGGTLTAIAGTSSNKTDSAGLTIHGDIIMNAGVINAVGATSGSSAYGIFLKDSAGSSDITISGGTLNAKGGSGALSKAPTAIANVTARASRDMSGSAPETYDSTKNGEYKWFSTALPTPPSSGGGSISEVYLIIRGQNGIWQRGSAAGLSFTANGDHGKFLNVWVDGVYVSGNYYTARAGSTIIEFKPEYLATLSTGEHTLRVNYLDGYAETEFTVGDGFTNVELPKTGDSPLPVLWLGAVLLAGLAAGGVLRRRRA